jgi:preprotein translocase subunit YajC
MFISPAFAQAGGATGSGFMEFLPLILIAVVFYFLLIRPQQKRAKEHKSMVAAVRRGDNVVTAGGIMGKVVKVESAEEVVVEIADGVRVSVVTSTLSDVRSKGEPAKDNDN